MKLAPSKKHFPKPILKHSEEMRSARDDLYNFMFANHHRIASIVERIHGNEVNSDNPLKNRGAELWSPYAAVLEMCGRNPDDYRDTFKRLYGFSKPPLSPLKEALLQAPFVELRGAESSEMEAKAIYGNVPFDLWPPQRATDSWRGRETVNILADLDVIDMEDVNRGSSMTKILIRKERLVRVMEQHGVPLPDDHAYFI
jgi:hypothetical protein